MSRSKALAVAVLALAGVAVGTALWPGGPGAGRAGAQGGAAGPEKAPAAPLPPFAPEAGKHYQIFMPDGRPYPGDRKVVLVQKVYANGWVEVKTEEDQTSWLNLNHAMQLYRIDDVAKWRQLAFPTGDRK
jgi:hypothetical protein